MAGERTEQASPQRRDKARREGDILHSRELTSAAGTLAGVLMLGWVGPRFLTGWAAALGSFLSYGGISAWESQTLSGTMRSLLALAMVALSPVALVGAGVTAAAFAVGMLQTGGIHLHPQVLGLRGSRMNPLANLKNLFSLRSAARLGKSMIPATILAMFAFQRLVRQWDTPPFSSVRLIALGGDVYDLLLAAAWLLFAWAAIDYLVEWRSREQRLKMSRQEQREEFKESEGNPQVRGRIRNLQRMARRRRLQADVAKAAVVITNPTHYAVALDFNFATMDAPKVLTKGRNLLAEEIKAQARWAGVPILENPPLARSLYRSVEPGQAIPVDLYAAVAAILAFLYRQRVEQEMRTRRERAAKAGRTAPPAGDASPNTAVIRSAPAPVIQPAIKPAIGPAATSAKSRRQQRPSNNEPDSAGKGKP